MSTCGWDANLIMTREGGRDDQIASARNELFEFAETALQKLVKREKRAYPHCNTLGIELLCRVDVSIIDNAKGGLDYFVNEVERGAIMVLYPNEFPQCWIDRLSDNLAIRLPMWLTQIADS